MQVTAGPDGRFRCPWANQNQTLRSYHDTEWGIPVAGEQAYFERLSLEGFQSGLSWLTILNKRERFREVFCGFEVDSVAGLSDADLEQILTDPGIIRNRAKIHATRHNARVVQKLRAQGGLESLIESFRPGSDPAPISLQDAPSTSTESIALSRALRGSGMKFVGPTTAYALMEALGLVNGHLVGCYRRGGED